MQAESIRYGLVIKHSFYEELLCRSFIRALATKFESEKSLMIFHCMHSLCKQSSCTERILKVIMKQIQLLRYSLPE